jgi:hypothetical protein
VLKSAAPNAAICGICSATWKAGSSCTGQTIPTIWSPTRCARWASGSRCLRPGCWKRGRTFQDINTDYTGFLYDESGCSDADVHQLSRLYLWTGGSSERYVTVAKVKRGEDDEGSWAQYFTTPGTVIARHFFSQKAYAAGEWVYGAIGVKDFNCFWVDDMTCRSRMVSQWFVKQIAVRSTGAP